MAASKGDVELIIRAKNEASRNLDAVNKSLKALADQQTVAGDSANQAQGKFAQLGQQLQALRTNAANLKSLSSIAAVLETATAALGRMRTSAADAGTALESLTQRQTRLAAEGAAAAATAKQTGDAVKSQSESYKTAQKAVSDLTREANKLSNEEKRTQGSIDTTVTRISTLNAKLQESVTKHAAASKAVNDSENATKRQQQALEAAERAMTKRQAALDAAVAKEAALRAALEQTAQSASTNRAALDTATAALANQKKVLDDARSAHTASTAAVKALASAEQAVQGDVAKATAEHQKHVTALKAAEEEYARLRALADQARAAVGNTAPALNNAGTAAGQAAIQLATMTARLAALASSSGSGRSPTIIDPAAIRAGEGSVRELGVTIRLAGNEATKSTVSMDQLKAAVQGVGATKTQLTGLGEALTRQNSAVTQAKQQWAEAQAEVKRLAQALRASSEPSETLAAGLGRAQAAARNAKTAFTEESVALNTLLASLQQAGIGAGNFASAEAALATRITNVNGLLASGQASLNGMTGALNGAGNAAGQAEPKVNGLANAMKSLLNGVNGIAAKTNPLGGLTGSITSAVGAAVGLYGIKDQLDKILQAGLALDGNKQRFASAFGSVEAGTKELEYAREVAMNLKLPINDLARGYSRLALAAKGTALEGDSARKIFEAFAQSSRVNQTSTADLEGVFTALTQIMSKGKVQAEELRQQLGDRLPGALQLMADGLGITVKELDGMMKKGELTSTTLINMAGAVSNRVAPVLAQALQSPAAKIQDFNNRVTILRENIAGSGFLDAFASGLEKIGTALSTPEAISGARELGQALADMVSWLAQAPEHFDGIVTAIKALGAAWVALQISSMVTGIYSLVTAIGATTVAVFALDVALSPILVGLAALAAVVATVTGLFVGWKLAEWAYENFPAFAEGVQGVKQAALDAWDGIISAWETVGAQLKASFGGVTDRIKKMWYGMLNDILSVAPTLTAKIGLGDIAADIAKQADEYAEKDKQRESNLAAELEEIDKRRRERQEKNARDTEDAIFMYHYKRLGDREKLDANAANNAFTAPGMLNMGGPQVGFPGAPQQNTGFKFGEPAKAGLGQVTGIPAFVKDTSAEDAKAAARAAKQRIALEKSVQNEMYSIRAKLEGKSADELQEKIDAVPAKYAALYAKLDQLGKGENDRDRQAVNALVAREQEMLRIADVAKRVKEEEKAEADALKARREQEKQVMTDVNTLYTTRKDIMLQMAQAAQVGDDETYVELRDKLKEVNQEYAQGIESALGFWAVSDSPQADNMIAKLEKMRTAMTAVKSEAVLTSFAVGKTLGSSLKSATDGFVDNLANGKGVIASLKSFFLDFARSFLINIAKMILQQILLNALQAGLGGAFGAGAQAGAGATTTISSGSAFANVAHDGGTVGQLTRTRSNVNAGDFSNAIRYHGGGKAGLTGLANDEVRTVLQKGEIIRTEAQEAALQRNMAGGGGPSSDQMPVNLKIVNAIDSASVLNEGLSSVPGQQVFMNFLRANKGKIQGILN